MKIEIEPCKIVKDPRNQVTSSNVFKKNQRKISKDYKYDDNGLFSKKIFGNIGRCQCGEQTTPGYCKECGTRVVDANNMPDFYIDLGVLVPKLYCDYGKYKDVKGLLEFKDFLYIDEEGNEHIIDNEDLNTDTSSFDPTHIVIGLQAARCVHEDIDEWAERYMTDYIYVPHTTRRPNLRLANGGISFSSINKSLIEILKNLELVNQFKFVLDTDNENYKPETNFYVLDFCREIYKQYINSMKEIFAIFTSGKSSFIGSNLKGHRITGAIKGTIINRYDVDEDVALIGDTFIQTLYPYLYKKFNGDMQQINDYFVNNDEVVLLNRPPTICHLSIVALKPRVASCYKFGTFNDGALSKNTKSEYDEDIDTLGIRTIGINPIITNGLAGDFDGDTVLVISIYSNEAKKEANTMMPSDNYMNYPNGTIRNVIPEDIMFANQ